MRQTHVFHIDLYSSFSKAQNIALSLKLRKVFLDSNISNLSRFLKGFLKGMFLKIKYLPRQNPVFSHSVFCGSCRFCPQESSEIEKTEFCQGR